MTCRSCGSVGSYADDTTYSCSGSNSATLSNQLSGKFSIMSDFLVSNKLKLNDDKSHLMVMATQQSRAIRKGTTKDCNGVVIRTPSEVIEQSRSEILLGCWLHQDMNFDDHILGNNESVLRSLNTRIGALKIIRKVVSFKVRRVVANGIFMSKVIYLIELCGGSPKYLLGYLQKA